VAAPETVSTVRLLRARKQSSSAKPDAAEEGCWTKCGTQPGLLARGSSDVTSQPRSPAPPAADPQAVEAIAAIGRFASARGWVAATSGNFSCRLDADHALLTRSGIDKGAIGVGDVAVVPLDGPIPPGMSAETPLHLARYRSSAAIGAIVHVHTVAATVLSRADLALGYVRLRGFEMQKALSGITTHESVVDVPVFANGQDTTALAATVESRLTVDAAVPGYLLAGHGLYAWGATMGDARRHLEGLEFLLTCTLEERKMLR
jgi:methylthioribulose-1-phosphate dehydratase